MAQTPVSADVSRLIADLRDSRSRLLWLVEDLSDEQLRVPLLHGVNPLLWELGHVAWFQERWTLRRPDVCQSLLEESDQLYDSAAVAHDTRWILELPSRTGTLSYLSNVLAAVCARLEAGTPDESEAYFLRLVTFHEDMHAEALSYARQTLAYSAPRAPNRADPFTIDVGPCSGDVDIPGGTMHLGAFRDAPFVFDNEKWAHPAPVEPFSIARAPVTQAEFAEFVEANGYRHEEWWSDLGRRWLQETGAEHPLYWRREPGGRWSRLHYDRSIELEEHKPVVHVSWYEAEAYCKFRGRRLPTEAEWELAASGTLDERGHLSPHKRLYPWGDEPPTAERAHLGDFASHVVSGTCAVGAYPHGDSAFGCRQMIGNVWEWTASDFLPYSGFIADPYKEYSEPWFGTHKVLRGGAFATRARLLRNTWRNFYTPDRRDVFAGFRTCRR